MSLDSEEINNYIISKIKEISLYCSEQYDLGDWKIHLTLDYSHHRQYQYGGTITRKNIVYPYVNLSLYDLKHRKIKGFREYNHYYKNKIIGSIRTNDWKIYLTCLITHELSHCVQWYLPISSSNLKINDSVFKNMPTYESNHGSFFQSIYSNLRAKYVNNNLSISDIGVQINETYGKYYSPVKTIIII